MRRLTLVATALLAAAPLHAQFPQSARMREAAGRDDRAFTFYDRGPYRPAVPRPESLLGYELGALNTQHSEQQRVLLAIADAAKDRVRVEEIGSTAERRPMRLFIVSSPENIARLDAIRADLDALSDPRGKTAAQLDQLTARTPAVVWINESVHGNESPGFETVMATLYQLAASDEPATMEMLRNVVVVLNPSTNPDGHERFSVWYNSIHVGDPNNWSLEHDEPWSIQGRYNHYRFDMNRDVAASTQREVQALLRGMLRWHPMVAVDQHGQVSTYFFPPAARPVNVNIGPQSEKWLDIIGRANAAAFDKYGWMYYVRDQFDLGGPFYWDAWPALTGATGMTYETDGGGWKGILWKREDGSLLSFRDGIIKHYVTALATIGATAGRAPERVRDYVAFRRNAVELGRTERMKRIVMVPGADPARAGELVSALIRSGIEVRRATAAFSAPRAHAYYDDATASRRFDAGVYVIDLAQPQGRLAKAFLEPADELDPVFARTQVEKYRRNLQRGRREGREYYEFYDVTAWSLPVAFGVEAYWTEDAGSVTGELLSLPAEESARDVPRRVGGELLPVDVGGGIVAGRGARSAYLFTSERSGAQRLAWQLMDEGFRVGIALQPIEAGERDWPRGTYVVRTSRNDTTLATRIDSLAREAGVEVTGVNTAYTTKAQFGIGSEPVQSLVPPKVGMVGDEGIGQTAYGALWWTFERRWGIRFTPVNWSGVQSALGELNVLIIPPGSAGEIGTRLGKSGADALKAWVERGGTLITMGGASSWAAREDAGLTSARIVGQGSDTTASGASKDTSKDTARKAVVDTALLDLTGLVSPTASNDRPQSLAGSNFDVVLDRTHWLTVGYTRPRQTVLVTGGNFFKPSREGSNVAVFPTSGLLARGGFTWPENTERLLRGTSLVIDEPLGSGHVILFANEPTFRGWWRALDKLVLNAIVLGPGM